MSAEKVHTESLAKANERTDVLQRKFEEQDAAALDALEQAHQRCDKLQQELDQMARVQAEVEARAMAEAELRKIFRTIVQRHSGCISPDQLLALGKAADPNFTRQKFRNLIDGMDTGLDGKVSADEFVALMQKAVEGLAEPAKQKGMTAMGITAEELARTEQAEAVREEKQARVKAAAEAQARHEAEARAKADAKALLEANKWADILQRTLDEQDAAARKALEVMQQRCDQLQQELEKTTKLCRAQAKAETKAREEAGLIYGRLLGLTPYPLQGPSNEPQGRLGTL